jgi:hypothetical protein
VTRITIDTDATITEDKRVAAKLKVRRYGGDDPSW